MSLWSNVRCPVCGQPGAKQLLWMVKCPRRGCSKYDPDLGLSMGIAGTSGTASPLPQFSGNFNPGANAIAIRYRNWEGVERSFTGDRSTLRLVSRHITVCLSPTGQRCSFSRDRFLNPGEIEPLIKQAEKANTLSAADRHVLSYHRNHGTTSPRYEEVKRKLGEI